MNLLEVKNISKTYGTGEATVHALKQATFSIPKGEFVAIVGESGSGKSTLLNMIGALDTPTSVSYTHLDVYKRQLLAAVQESPFRLTTLEQFREFPANTEYFVLEANISKVEDVGWRYLAQHLDTLLPPELLDAIDPVPFGKYAVQEEQGCFTSRGYLTLSGDEWQHGRPQAKQADRKPSIRERLEQSRQECRNKNKAQAPRKGKSEPEL